METLIAFGIALLVTILFVRHYVKGLSPAAPAPAAPAEQRACPRCGQSIPKGAGFCNHCGAALALWTVHSADIAQPGAPSAEPGKPRPVINASLCIGCGSCVEACPEQGTLAMAGGKAILAHPERCVGHARCVTACPTSGVSLAFGNVLQTLRVPMVRENFETNVSGVFIVGELGGMGLIKTSINEGRLVADHIRARLEAGGFWSRKSACEDGHAAPPESVDDGGPYDVVIAGAGPAGLSASLTFQQYGIRYLTLEQGEVASTIRQYPRKKFLMAEPVEMPLYGTLYINDSTKESLLEVWETILANTGVRIRTNEKVEAVQRNSPGGLLHVKTPNGSYETRFVVLAMGKRGTPRKLSVPGEELSKVTYRLIEADTYSGSNVVVVGGGDSAIEAAVGLAKGGRNRVTLVHRAEDFARARDRNRGLLEEAEKAGRITIRRKSQLAEIKANSVIIQSGVEVQEIPNDFVFVLIGGESPEEFLRRTGVEIVERSIAA